MAKVFIITVPQKLDALQIADKIIEAAGDVIQPSYQKAYDSLISVTEKLLLTSEEENLIDLTDNEICALQAIAATNAVMGIL